MSKRIQWFGLASVAGLGIWIGRVTAPAGEPQVERVEVEAQASPRCDVPSKPRLAGRWQPKKEGGAPRPVRTDRPESFTMAERRDLDDATRSFLSYAEGRLAAGPEGHLELLETFDREIIRNREAVVELGGGDEAEITRQIYPFIRFLVEHEDGMIAMTETVFETMANDPARLEGVDDDTLEAFTEGLALLLPGAVSEAELDRFREHASRVLETPEDQLPESVLSQRSDLERAVDRYWAKPIPAGEVVERLRVGPASSREAERLFRRVPSDELRGLDPVAVYGRMLANGDLRSIRYLGLFAVDAGAVTVLDQILLDGTSGVDPYEVIEYLRATGRTSWESQAPFFQAAERSPRAAWLADAATRARPEVVID
jgi:hypothetical protein